MLTSVLPVNLTGCFFDFFFLTTQIMIIINSIMRTRMVAQTVTIMIVVLSLLVEVALEYCKIPTEYLRFSPI